MYVAKVKVENIRGFHDARKVGLDLPAAPGWCVVIGPNGSGRTTFLQSIALAIGGPSFAPAFVAGSVWVTAGKERGGIEVDLVPGEQDRFARGSVAPEGGIFADLVVTASGVSVDSNVGRNGPWQENPVGWFAVGYGAHRRPAPGVPRAQPRLAGLFRADATLSETVVPSAMPLIRDGLLPEEYTLDADAEGVWAVRDGARIPLRALGDGYRSLIALVLDLVRQLHSAGLTAETATGVVLLDEPEAHLTLEWQQWIGGWLLAHFPGLQFIVGTNSPYVCQAATPGGLISLAGPPRIVEGDLYERVVHGSAEDVALSELVGLESSYPPRAQRLRQELVELEIRVLDGEASEVQLARYRELQELLVSSPTARAAEIAARLRRR
jgi:hypothetical protein